MIKFILNIYIIYYISIIILLCIHDDGGGSGLLMCKIHRHIMLHIYDYIHVILLNVHMWRLHYAWLHCWYGKTPKQLIICIFRVYHPRHAHTNTHPPAPTSRMLYSDHQHNYFTPCVFFSWYGFTVYVISYVNVYVKIMFSVYHLC